jgi:SAM-dependent methyltransferase
MKINSVEKKYDSFHGNTMDQKRVIRMNNFTYRIALGVIMKYLKQDDRILDIGCGSGTLSFFFAAMGNRVCGIDVSKRAIESCTRSSRFLKLNKTSFKIMDFPNVIPSETYDFVILCEVLEHLKEDSKALEKIFDLLKPGGIAVISTPSKNAPLFRMGRVQEFDKRVGHLRRYDLSELISISKRAGFIVLEAKKTEGILRNFLFVNPWAGRLVRYIKFFISDLITLLDNILIPIFGESNIFIVVERPLYEK